MKTGRVFWGVFFVAVGLLFLFGDSLRLDLDVNVVWQLWPVVLILIGLKYLFKNPAARITLASITALLIALFIYAIFSFNWVGSDEDGEGYTGQGQDLSQPYDSTMKRVSFNVELGAGTFLLDGTSDDLITAATNTTFGHYSLDFERESMDGETKLRLNFEGESRHMNLRKMKNRAEVRLNPNPVWDVDVDAGAAKVDFDLSPYKVENFTLDAGAATVKLKFGGLVQELQGRIQIGASSLRIEIPDSVGCEIRLDSGLSSKHFTDFEKVNDDTYQTPDFGQTNRKIYLSVEAGVSSIRVVRY